MKRRKFVAASSLLPFAAMAKANSLSSKEDKLQNNVGKEIYELRTYQLSAVWKKDLFAAFLKNALVPALNRVGVKNVGVFEEYGKSEPPKIYVFIPFATFELYSTYLDILEKDEQFKKDKESFDKIEIGNKVYKRYTSDVMIAFSGMPQMNLPKTKERIFEIRFYEGYNDDAVRRKVKMFNEGEFDIFEETELYPIFFGKAIAGENLPKLTYMLAFENMEQRDANWSKFGAHPMWDKMRNDPQYANTVSNIDKVFLLPMDMSQV